MKKKLVYLATRWAWPVSSGRMLMIDQEIKMLSKEYDIHFVYIGKGKNNNVDNNDFISYKQIKAPNLLEIGTSILKNIFTFKPLQYAMFSSKRIKSEISTEIDYFHPDVIFCDQLRMFENVHLEKERLHNRKVVMDIDDLISFRFEKMIKNNTKNILGEFANRLPNILNIFVNKISKLLLKYEYKALRRQEYLAPKKVDHVFIVSKVECEKLKQETGCSNITPLPPCVDIHEYQDRDFSNGYTFIYLGPETYAPNFEAINGVEKIAEVIDNKEEYDQYDIAFEHIGKYRTDIERPYIARHGFVANLDDVLINNVILLAPILSGSGVKIKILEAMSRGIPVITTETGAESLGPNSQNGLIMIPNDLEGQIRVIDNVLKMDKNVLSSFGKLGYNYVNENHRLEIIENSFLDKFE